MLVCPWKGSVQSCFGPFSAFCTIPNSPGGAKITVLGGKTAHLLRNTRSEVIMTLELANMDDISVVYPGRVFIGHLIAPGLLSGVCAIFSQWSFCYQEKANSRPLMT